MIPPLIVTAEQVDETVATWADAVRRPPHGLGRGDADHSPANAAHLDNVADFVRKAALHGIHVLPRWKGW